MNATTLVVIVLIGLLPAWIASRKGHNFFGWWLFGSALFIVALPIAIFIKPDERTRQTCPWCRTTIDRQAVVCPQCGRDVAVAVAVQS
jgi:hypothetical protein